MEDLGRIESAVKGDVFEGKKVLITGGAGFIGSWLCDVLVSFGAEVVAVDDLSTGRMKNIDHLTKDAKFKLVKCDVCAFHEVDDATRSLNRGGALPYADALICNRDIDFVPHGVIRNRYVKVGCRSLYEVQAGTRADISA